MYKIDVVIQGCDKYSFIFDEFLSYFQNFPRTIFDKTYFCNEEVDVNLNDGIIQIKTGVGEWSDRLIKILSQTKNQNIIYIQEDFFIKNVNIEELENGINFHLSNNNDITKFGYFSSFILETYDLLINKQSNKSSYLISHQPISIFKKDFLLSTLSSNINCWQHEQFISNEASVYCYGKYNQVIQYHHALYRGVRI